MPGDYVQCRLTHAATNRSEVSFIPSAFAKVGTVLRVNSGPYEDGWRVDEVYESSRGFEPNDTFNARRRFERVLKGH